MASLAPYSGTLDQKKAAHLLRRTTFGPSRKQIDGLVGRSVSQALSVIYENTPPPGKPFWLTSSDPDTDLRDYFKKWSLNLMRVGGESGISGIERMVFFLHTIFTTRISIVENHEALYHQNTLLRFYSLGNIKELAKKISIDNAMLILLDGNLNVKGNPNENYARELFELYTIGKGIQTGPGNYTNFTEDDIKQAAKVLSGWKVDTTFRTIDPITSVPSGKINATQHDFSSKTFSAAFQGKTISPAATTGAEGEAAAVKELDDLIDMIFAQKETARNYCRKIYRFFMYYNITPEIEKDIIDPLADTLFANNYELKPVLFQLLQSSHFFDEDTPSVNTDNNRSAIIKSPLEVVLGTLRFFDVEVTDVYKHEMLKYMFEQGLDLYEPFDVAGYDAYHQAPAYNRNWITSNTLAKRYEFANKIVPLVDPPPMEGMEPEFKFDILRYVEDPANISDPFDVDKLVNDLITYLLPEAVSTTRYRYFVSVLNEGLPNSNWAMEWNMYVNTGVPFVVRNQLKKLFNQLLQSPEYQLF